MGGARLLKRQPARQGHPSFARAWLTLAVFYVLSISAPPARAAELPKMDTYTPDAPNGIAVLAVHGGGWYQNSRRSMARVCTEIVLPTGATCFASDYTLSGVAPYPAANRDLVNVVAHIRSVGYSRVGAVGSSAGGTLVAWLASRGVVDYGVVWSAPTDLTRLRDWPPGAIRRYAPKRWMRRAASPALRDIGVPLLVLHARHDPLIPVAQARLLRTGKLRVFAGRAHGLALFDRAAGSTLAWLETHDG